MIVSLFFNGGGNKCGCSHISFLGMHVTTKLRVRSYASLCPIRPVSGSIENIHKCLWLCGQWITLFHLQNETPRRRRSWGWRQTRRQKYRSPTSQSWGLFSFQAHQPNYPTDSRPPSSLHKTRWIASMDSFVSNIAGVNINNYTFNYLWDRFE